MKELYEGTYSADGGAFRVDTPDAYFHFLNGIGDGTFEVTVVKGMSRDRKLEFIGSFGVKTQATVSGYDCADEPVFTLPRGRYGVHRDGEGNILLDRWDDHGV